MRTTVQFLRRSALVFAVLVLAIASDPPASRAQGGSEAIENSAGLTFIVGFPDTTSNTIDPRYPNNRYDEKCYFFIYSAVDNKISIHGSNYQRIGMHIRGGAFTIIDLMQSDNKAPNPITAEQCKVTHMGIFRIEAQ